MLVGGRNRVFGVLWVSVWVSCLEGVLTLWSLACVRFWVVPTLQVLTYGYLARRGATTLRFRR